MVGLIFSMCINTCNKLGIQTLICLYHLIETEADVRNFSPNVDRHILTVYKYFNIRANCGCRDCESNFFNPDASVIRKEILSWGNSLLEIARNGACLLRLLEEDKRQPHESIMRCLRRLLTRGSQHAFAVNLDPVSNFQIGTRFGTDRPPERRSAVAD